MKSASKALNVTAGKPARPLSAPKVTTPAPPAKRLRSQAPKVEKTAPPSFTALIHSQLPQIFNIVKEGLPPSIVDEGADYLGIPKMEFVGMLQMSSSSLSRWTREKRTMPQAESDRVARVARVAMVVEKALGSREDAVDWLNSKIPALGNAKPLGLLGSDSGVKIVEDLLVRAQAGVFG